MKTDMCPLSSWHHKDRNSVPKPNISELVIILTYYPHEQVCIGFIVVNVIVIYLCLVCEFVSVHNYYKTKSQIKIQMFKSGLQISI